MSALAGDELDEELAPEKPKRDYKAERKRRGVAPGGRRAPASPEVRLRESLEAVADWLRDRGDRELGDVLHRDAPKMARVLGQVANINPLAKKVIAVLADVLEPVRAFGPTLRVLWRRLLARRAARLEELELEPEELLHEVVVPGPVEPELGAEQAEPWRIRE